MKTLIIDNYDSFTYNLFHYVEGFTSELKVVRSDVFRLDYVEPFDNIILSPGPGLPEGAGLMLDVIKNYYKEKRILGICLGHQAIVEAFGGRLKNLDKVLHGFAVETYFKPKDSYIFKDIPEKINTGRYHSFVADREMFPSELEVIAEDIYGEIQGIKHREYDVIGLQFHPESILTDYGKQMIGNWMEKGYNR